MLTVDGTHGPRPRQRAHDGRLPGTRHGYAYGMQLLLAFGQLGGWRLAGGVELGGAAQSTPVVLIGADVLI